MICVIPARSGSKRIPHKNIKSFCGNPIIFWSILAARKSKLFDKIVVSTNCDEIKAVALKYGAEVPFKRPNDLADDFATTNDVMLHATSQCEALGYSAEVLCCLYATAPFVTPMDLQSATRAIHEKDWDYVFSAAKYPSSIFRSFTILPDGAVEMVYPDFFSRRTQDLDATYYDAGMFYFGKKEAWLSGERIFGERSHPLLIPQTRVHDIDDQDDWERAELFAKTLFPNLAQYT